MNDNNSALTVSSEHSPIPSIPSSASIASTVSIAPDASALDMESSRAPSRARVGSKREALLRCAREQFAAKGFVGTPIAMVASSVSIRKSTFFHYFQDKDALYDAAVRAVLDELALSVVEVGKHKKTFEAQLDALVAHVWRFLAVEPSLPRLLLRSMVDEPLPDATRPTPLDRIARSFADAVQRGVDEGRLAACDPLQEAMGVIAFLCAHASTSSALTVPVSQAQQLNGTSTELRLVRVQQRVRALLPNPARG